MEARVEAEVYYLNVFLEVEHGRESEMGEVARDLRRVGNLFPTLVEAKKAQADIRRLLAKKEGQP